MQCATINFSHFNFYFWQEFELNTPDIEATKMWVGNLGKTATHAMVFAQLYTPDGTCHGLHRYVKSKALFTRYLWVCVNVKINFNVVFMIIVMQTQRMGPQPFSALVSPLTQCKTWCKRNTHEKNINPHLVYYLCVDLGCMLSWIWDLDYETKIHPKSKNVPWCLKIAHTWCQLQRLCLISFNSIFKRQHCVPCLVWINFLWFL